MIRGFLAIALLVGCGESSAPGSPVASLTVSPSDVRLVLGQSGQQFAVARDASDNVVPGRSITWTTSAPSIATVSATGLVTGVGAGSATITATADGKSGAVQVSVASLTFVSVASGGAHTCALKANGDAWCWGRGESGQIGAIAPSPCPLGESGTLPCSLVAVPVGGGVAFAKIVGGGEHTCGLTADGSAYCFGRNWAGQLGDGTTANRSEPVAVSGGLKFATIEAGQSHTCGVTASGTAYCWGRNDRGQLGDGTTTTIGVPVLVAGGLAFQSLTAGGWNAGHTCGLTSTGVAYCWGDNRSGELGVGAVGPGLHLNPTLVTGGLTFVALTAGLHGHTCGLIASGAAYCWGNNSFGPLGNRSTLDSPAPTPVYGDLTFTRLSAGGYIGHTCGLVSSGAAYCWGENERGQVGDGSTEDRIEPTAVLGGLAFTSLDAGYRHTCGLASTGIAYCWGSGAAGQLGTNSAAQQNQPAKVLGQP